MQEGCMFPVAGGDWQRAKPPSTFEPAKPLHLSLSLIVSSATWCVVLPHSAAMRTEQGNPSKTPGEERCRGHDLPSLFLTAFL